MKLSHPRSAPASRARLLVLVLLAACLVRPAAAPAPVEVVSAQRGHASSRRAAPAPAPAAEGDRRVLIVTIDGLRPDVLLRASAPNVRRLMASGTFTMWATTVPECYTLPAHVSIFTGVAPQKHGVEWNDHIEEAFPLVPTLFDLAARNGLVTAMATGKTKFIALDRPGSITWKYLPRDEPIPDAFVATQAVEILGAARPHVLFVHFADTDNIGHSVGWGTLLQLQAIEEADRQLGVVLAAVERLGLKDSTLVMLTSDHGGAGLEHGPDDPRSRHVPWLIAGPGVRRGFDLTRLPDLHVTVYDTFAMACHFLGLALEHETEGKVVWDAFEETKELLRDRR